MGPYSPSGGKIICKCGIVVGCGKKPCCIRAARAVDKLYAEGRNPNIGNRTYGDKLRDADFILHPDDFAYLKMNDADYTPHTWLHHNDTRVRQERAEFRRRWSME